MKKLTCGSSTQIGQFEIATYVYIPPVEHALAAAPREGEDQGSGKQPKATNEEQAKENEKLLVTAELH